MPCSPLKMQVTLRRLQAYQGMIDDMDDAEFEYLADAASPGPEFKIYA
jgi:hypothetical protein